MPPPTTRARRSILDDFRDELIQLHGATSGTPRTYHWGADLLAQYLTRIHRSLTGFSPAVWEGFAVWLTEQPDLRIHSRQTALRGAKAFCEWGAAKGYCPTLTREEWKRARLPSQEPLPAAARQLPQPAVVILTQHIQTEIDPYRTVLLLLRAQGLEASELCGAPWHGAWAAQSPTHRLIWVRGRRCRLTPDQIVQLTPDLYAQYLKRVDLNDDGLRLIRAYTASGLPGRSPWLFASTTEPHRPLAPDTVRNVFEDIRERAGMTDVTLRLWSGR